MTNDSKFYMRLAADELEMLKRLAEERRTSAAHVVRECIRREHAKAFGELKRTRKAGSR